MGTYTLVLVFALNVCMCMCACVCVYLCARPPAIQRCGVHTLHIYIYYLGIAQTYSWEDVVTGGGGGDKSKELTGVHNASHSPTPPPQRRLAKSFSVAPSTTSKGIIDLLLLYLSMHTILYCTSTIRGVT